MAPDRLPACETPNQQYIRYTNQIIFVRWSRILSEGFQVSNGVRQGGILSPYLFIVYIDDLSAALTKCRTGCCIDDMNINHLMYADDLVVNHQMKFNIRKVQYSYVEESI